MIVRITQLDGKLPNLALMRLGAWHRAQGDDVRWEKGTTRRLDEPAYDLVYGSAIFAATRKAADLFARQFPGAIIGGSGGNAELRVEDIVPTQFTGVDYSGHPDFTASIGYSMRGCRFRCTHCIVPGKEGLPSAADSIGRIWRGPGFPKNIHLLDNDFFGAPGWRDTVRDIVDGGYKVCLNQGVTARVMNDEQARAVVAMHPYDDGFKRARLYVAWDHIDQERVFMRGIDALERAGWKPEWCFSYMLVGHDPDETWERIHHRFERMVARGIRPYPMVFGGDERTPAPAEYRRLKRFQRWVVTGAYKVAPFEEYTTRRLLPQKGPTLFDHADA